MTLPYYSDATKWADIRAIDAWVEYPFEDQNDLVTKEYKIRCNCRNEDYESPAYSDTMSSASAAKLIDLPFTADSNAYFLGDSNFSSGEGGATTFLRTFGAVPQTRTLAEQSYDYTFPGYRAFWHSGSGAPPDIVFLINLRNSKPVHNIRAPQTKAATAKFVYTYYYRTDKGLGLSTDQVFKINQYASTGPYPIFNTLYYPSIPYVDDVDYVADGLAQGSAIFNGTNPSQSTYFGYLNSGTFLLAESNVEHYKGNIFVKRNIYVKAQ
ncbi:MAG: hypothetical protein GY727_06550 [Gammaproteobacteria bacterium]|nr:hypothetical protein [Gammaproteobacteria bacterium]